MDYFCYISRSKVDQLYHALAPGEADEWTEQRSTEQKLDTSLTTDLTIGGIISLFKAGLTYGRKGVIQREQKLKLQYVEKLRRVLLEIAKDSPIPSLKRALDEDSFPSLYCHHEGSFAIGEPVGDVEASVVVTLMTRIERVAVALDCSLSFFSEANQTGGRFSPNSSNARFFAGSIPLHMQTVFLILHRQPRKIVGTPLYLKLPDTAGQIL